MLSSCRRTPIACYRIQIVKHNIVVLFKGYLFPVFFPLRNRCCRTEVTQARLELATIGIQVVHATIAPLPLPDRMLQDSNRETKHSYIVCAIVDVGHDSIWPGVAPPHESYGRRSHRDCRVSALNSKCASMFRIWHARVYLVTFYHARQFRVLQRRALSVWVPWISRSGYGCP